MLCEDLLMTNWSQGFFNEMVISTRLLLCAFK